jgi:hypothetical protein
VNFGTRLRAVHNIVVPRVVNNGRHAVLPRLEQRGWLDRGSTATDHWSQILRRLLLSHSTICVGGGTRCCAPAGPQCRRRLTTACLASPDSTRTDFDECTRHMHNPMYSPASGATSGGPSAGASATGVRGMEPGRSPGRASAERRSSCGQKHEAPDRWLAESDCASRYRRQHCTTPTVSVQSYAKPPRAGHHTSVCLSSPGSMPSMLRLLAAVWVLGLALAGPVGEVYTGVMHVSLVQTPRLTFRMLRLSATQHRSMRQYWSLTCW